MKHDVPPPQRRRSAAKNAMILDAARSLFLANGYELTSVDAIADSAGVSKRTVYDHFGDKESLFVRVYQRACSELSESIRSAASEELTGTRPLRDELLAFTRRMSTGTFTSSEYATCRQLRDAAGTRSIDNGIETEPEQILRERFAEFAERGLLRTTVIDQAVDHFLALTMLLALDISRRTPQPEDLADRIDGVLRSGVDAFLRAYASGT